MDLQFSLCLLSHLLFLFLFSLPILFHFFHLQGRKTKSLLLNNLFVIAKPYLSSNLQVNTNNIFCPLKWPLRTTILTLYSSNVLWEDPNKHRFALNSTMLLTSVCLYYSNVIYLLYNIELTTKHVHEIQYSTMICADTHHSIFNKHTLTNPHNCLFICISTIRSTTSWWPSQVVLSPSITFRQNWAQPTQRNNTCKWTNTLTFRYTYKNGRKYVLVH